MSMEPKKIVFLTGTRADYGKIKRVMKLVDASDAFQLYVFVTGMHMHKEYGSTYHEIRKDGYKNIYYYINQRTGDNSMMDVTLAHTIEGFSAYINETKPDMIIVHGDRLEAMAGAIVGVMNNILVGHIEGGELSGTIDESIRHSITKLAHVHFVSNEESKNRVMQLGEPQERIFVIGSPDIDVMMSEDLPDWPFVKDYYEIPFDDFGIALFHPVTTSYKNMGNYSRVFADALLASGQNYVVIHPNNDFGREFIVEEYQRLEGNARFRIFLSIRFEYFLTIMKQAKFIVGNSSAGIREAQVYGLPAIDIGIRQNNRGRTHRGLIHCDYDLSEIVRAIHTSRDMILSPLNHFGSGNSAGLFMSTISGEDFWTLPLQKYFIDKN